MQTTAQTVNLPSAVDQDAETLSWSLVPVHAWLQLTVLATLFVAVHWNWLNNMAAVARKSPDWSHAFLVPLFSLYFIHQQRDRILDTQARTCWIGLGIFLVGLFAHFVSIFPLRSRMFQGYAMIVELLGLTLLLLGPQLLRILLFPICYLAFGVQFSSKIWNFIAWRLQTFAAHSAATILNVVGIEADVRGSTIELWRGMDYLGALNVAEACSGLRMLIAFVALGVAVIYLVHRPWWARATMLLLAIPIAVAVNVIRVTVTGLLHLVNPELSAGDFHLLIGMVMILPAVMLFLLVGWLLDQLVIHECEDDHAAET